MDCRELFEQVSDYLDEQEKAELCAQIELHLKACPTCKVYVDTVRKTIMLYQTPPQAPIPVTVSARLQAALSKEYGSDEYRAASD